jgi:bifunctional DNA-binding transcriptional regulator/antitoxin component of YhaV-PrlF toxin-antitoxin module
MATMVTSKGQVTIPKPVRDRLTSTILLACIPL